MSRSLKEMIDGTRELRTLPTTTVRLLDLLDDATVGADAVLAVIEKDPSLTANLLKLCNSAYYGLRGRVATVRQAVVMLGNLTVVNLAFAASMGDILRGPLAAYRLDRERLWHHALATGVAAAYLSGVGAGARLGDRRGLRERAFTAGLVHDIGKLVANRPLRDHLEQLPVDADAAGMMAAEREILGFDHAQIGGALAAAWNFPPLLVAVIAGHHADDPGTEPATSGPDHAAAVHLARSVAAGNLIAEANGFPGGSAPPAPDTLVEVLARFGFAADDVAELEVRLADDVGGLLGVFGGGA
jgi:HD-like signal output (HDOD) protein